MPKQCHLKPGRNVQRNIIFSIKVRFQTLNVRFPVLPICALNIVILFGYEKQTPHCAGCPGCPRLETPTALFRYAFGRNKQHHFHVHAEISLPLKTKPCIYYCEKLYFYVQHFEVNLAGGTGGLYSLQRNQKTDSSNS